LRLVRQLIDQQGQITLSKVRIRFVFSDLHANLPVAGGFNSTGSFGVLARIK